MAEQAEHLYVEADRADAAVESRLAASAARRLAMRLLGLDPPPELRWFKQARTPQERLTARLGQMRREVAKLATRVMDPAVAAGKAYDPDGGWRQQAAHRRAKGLVSVQAIAGIAFYQEGDAVWVSAALSAHHAAWVTLHECYHRFQRASNTWPTKDAPGYGDADAGELAEMEADTFAALHVKEALAEAGY